MTQGEIQARIDVLESEIEVAEAKIQYMLEEIFKLYSLLKGINQ